MRNTWIALVIGAVVFTAAPAWGQGQQPAGAAAAAPQQQSSDSGDKFTLEGEAALWTVAIRPDKTADFERVLVRLREALMKSDKPERRQQAEGWVVLRLTTPLPDGNVAYVHDVRPVVKDADYSVMRILYEAFPNERQELYELYRGAFVRNVSLATGTVVLDPRGAASGHPANQPDTSTPPASTPPASTAPPSTPPPSTPPPSTPPSTPAR